MDSLRILIIPDACIGSSSGGTVTQILVKWLKQVGFTIAIFSTDVKSHDISDGIEYFTAPVFKGTANILSGSYKKAINTVLTTFNPSHVYFVGSITNKPLCYLEESYKRNLKVEIFIFMQDFFCSKFYANDAKAPCRKCLDNGLLSVFSSNCGVKSIGILKLMERSRTRIKLRKLLAKADHVGTSTDEQVQFYVDFGIPREKTYKLPLPFDDTKLKQFTPSRGNYIIGIAQNRIEKGFHFIPSILEHTNAKVVLAYYNEEVVARNVERPEYKKYIESGQLKLVAASWDSGLGELIAASQGVIIPSIWPTTTEYGWLEALALSKPTITFDISAHHEFMQNRVNGMLSPIGDFETMGANMDYLYLLSDKEYEVFTNNVIKLYQTLTETTIWIEFLKKIKSHE